MLLNFKEIVPFVNYAMLKYIPLIIKQYEN